MSPRIASMPFEWNTPPPLAGGRVVPNGGVCERGRSRIGQSAAIARHDVLLDGAASEGGLAAIDQDSRPAGVLVHTRVGHDER